MSNKSMLKLDWCSHAAAKYAVEHWHYSKTMIVGKAVYIGVWEDSHFTGCLIFSCGVNRNIGRPYHAAHTAVCELTRVALTTHQTPVSRIGTIAIKLLHRLCPGLRLLVSYADPAQGHIGTIYQAMGWVYVGRSHGTNQLLHAGRLLHKRVAHHVWGTADSALVGGKYLYPEEKHKYLYPLDAAMRAQIAPLAQPYPKRATSIRADASPDQGEEGGASPTVALSRQRVT